MSFRSRTVRWFLDARHAVATAAFLGLTAAASCLRAAPPEVTALAPAGGQRGSEVRVTVQGKFDPAALQLWTDRPGIELAPAEGKGQVTLKVADDAEPGVAWLRFYNAEGASGLRPFLINASAEAVEVEPNNAQKEAQQLAALPATVNGVLEKAGDVDAFAVPLRKGETLTAVLSARETLGSPLDGLLQIVAPRGGFVLAQNDDSDGFDARLELAAPEDGVYFVRVFAFPATPDSSIRFSGGATYIYRLLLTAGAYCDRVSPTAVEAGKPARVRPEGANLPADVGEMELSPLTPGLHPVRRDGCESTAVVYASPYPVVVLPAGGGDPAAPAGPVPVCVAGQFAAPKDVGVYRFRAQKGQKLTFRAYARSLFSLADLVLRIHDAAGQRLQEVDDAAQDDCDVVVDFAAPQDGEYVLKVAERFSHGGPRHHFAVTISEARPDFVLSVAADQYVVKPDAPLEIPLTVERRSGFNEDVLISAEGLPEGVTAEEVTAAADAKAPPPPRRGNRGGKREASASVKLVLKSTGAAAWSGPLKIVGKTDAEQPVEHPALVKSPLRGGTLPHVWLTVIAKPAS